MKIQCRMRIVTILLRKLDVLEVIPKYVCAVRLKCKTVCIPQSFHSRRGVKVYFSHNQHSRINLSAALAQTCMALNYYIKTNNYIHVRVRVAAWLRESRAEQVW
jgi:hypothetical protein